MVQPNAIIETIGENWLKIRHNLLNILDIEFAPIVKKQFKESKAVIL
jgi:hypothetical protein